MKTNNPKARAQSAFQKAVTKAQYQAQEHATLGWRRSATVVEIDVPGRANYVYVTRSDQTVFVARNEANVPRAAFLPVRVVLRGETYVIVGRDTSNDTLLGNVPDSPYGLPPHPLKSHSDVVITGLADGEVLVWDAALGAWVNASPTAGAVDSVNGQTGVVVLDTDDIAEGASNRYLTQERVEDYVGASATGGTLTGITVTYTDATGVLNFVLDAELVAIAGLTSAADRLPYFTGSGTAALATFTAAGRALVDDADAAAQRTTLGLVIGTNVQAYDATLLSIAALGTAADKLAYTTGVDTWAETALTSFGRSLVDDADAAAGRTTLGVVIGTNVQAYDATLASIAALGTAANKMLYSTGIDTWAEADLTAAGRAILDDADASAQRTTLGLVIGTNVQAQDAELAAIAGLTSAADRLPYFTGSGTAALATFSSFARTLVDDADAATMRATLGITGTIAYTQEEIEDFIGASATGGTQTGIAVTYNDTTGMLNFDAQTAGDARYGRLASNNTWSGTNKFDATVTLSPGGTQDYSLSDDGANALTLNALSTGKDFDFRIHTFDADGTDNVLISLYAVGKPGSYTNYERGRLIYAAASQEFRFDTGAAGSGTVRPLVLLTGSNTNQLRIETDGKVAVGGVTSIGANLLGIKAGSSTNDAAVGGVLYVTTTQTGNVGTGTDDIASYTIPANTLAVNGQSIWFEASGSIANNANAKTLLAVFGATTVYTTTPATGNADEWVIRGRIIRTGATTQKAYANIAARYASDPLINYTTAAETLSGAVSIKIQAVGVSNNDVVCETFVVGYDDNNT